MKAFRIVLVTVLWVAMVTGQDTVGSAFGDYSSGEYFGQPIFEYPGEIIPGIPVSYLINAVGGIWQQERVVDSLAYACNNVLPYLSSVVTELEQTSVYWSPICDKVIEAADDLDAFDASGVCNDIITTIGEFVDADTSERVRRQVDPSMEYPEMGSTDPLGIIGNLTNIIRDLYGIDLNMILNDTSTISTVCINVKDNFLRPSIPDIFSQVGAELLSALLPQATLLCPTWDGFLQSVGINSTSPFYPIIQDAARIGPQALGYNDIDELCGAITQALDDDSEARRTFSMNIIESLFDVLENAERCTMLASGALNDIVEPILNMNIDMNGSPYFTAADLVYFYTGFQTPDEICGAVEEAFTTEVEVPSPQPIQLIRGTSFTVEFFINAAGGLWQQDRLIDTLAYACSDVLPVVTATVPLLNVDSPSYIPICNEIQEAARNLDAFDSTGFCNNVIAMISGLVPDGETVYVDLSMGEALSIDTSVIIETFGNITRDLYGFNIDDPSTICPNIAQLLDRPLPGIITEIVAELMSGFLPQAQPLCQDWDVFLGDRQIYPSSTYYQLIEDGARIASQLLGYDNRTALCDEVLIVLNTGDDTARKNFSTNIISSVFTLLTDADTCSLVTSDVIEDIVEPLISIGAGYGLQIDISDYMIYRYTGYEDVNEICEAVETAFTSVVPLPLPAAGELIPGSGLTVSLIINLAGGFWAQDRFIDSMSYACTDILPVLSQTIPAIQPFRRYWKSVCDAVDEAVNDIDDFDPSGLCYGLQNTLTLTPFDLGGLGVPSTRGMPYPWGNSSTGGMPYPWGNSSTGGMPYPWGNSSTGGMPYPWGNSSTGGMPYPWANSSTGGMPYPWGNSSTSEAMAQGGFLYPLLQILANISQSYGIDINNLTTVCSNQATEFLEESLSDLILEYGSEVMSLLLPLAEPICQDWESFLGSMGVNSSLPYYQQIEDGARIASQLMGYDSRQALCQDLQQALAVEGDDGDARRAFTRGLLEELLSFLTSADTCTSISSDIIDDIIEPLISMFFLGGQFDVTDEMIHDFTGFMGVRPLCQAMATAFEGCRKRFELDACGICATRPGKSVQFHFMSKKEDCAGRCPRDDDFGARENDCGLCVLGATRRPADAGMNACGDCGRDAELSCVGCDGVLNSGLEYDACNMCGGDGTTCTTVTSITPAIIPADTEYEITILGAGFDGPPDCRFRSQDSDINKQVVMITSSASEGRCIANLSSGTYDLQLVFGDAAPVDTSIILQVYEPITIASLAQDEFTSDPDVEIVLIFTAAANFNFQSVADLTPYLTFPIAGFPPHAGEIIGDTMQQLSFTLRAPPSPGQLAVSASLNGIDPLPDGDFTITFFAPAPEIDSVTFAPSGNKLMVEFEDEVRILNFVDCSSIFLDSVQGNGVTRDLLDLFGGGSKCMLIINNRVILIDLGEGDNLIQPGDRLTLRGDVIFSRPEFSRALPETVYTIGNGDAPMVGVVLRGASTISSCGDVELSTRGSTGGASRSLTYTWSVESDGMLSSDLVDAVNAIMTPDLTVDGALLTENQNYTFTASTTNFLGGSGSDYIVVMRSAEQVPDLTISPRGIDPESVPVFRRFFLNADVTFYSDCEGAGPEETEFVWTADIEAFDDSVHGGTANSRTLLVQDFSIPGGSDVTFTVEARRAGATSVPTSSITVSFTSSDLVARILGGSERSVGVDSGMVTLDGSQSRDPDQSRDSDPADLGYEWICEQTTDETPCEYGPDGDTFPAESDSTSSTLTFDASRMTPDKTYRFTLEVSSGNRLASTSVLINALAGNPPSILVSRSSDERPVLSTESVSITTLVRHTTPVTIRWTITGQEIDRNYNLDTDAETVMFGSQTVSTTLINAGVLLPGEMYTVEVTATTTDGTGLSASSQLVLDVASGVSSCLVSLEGGNTYTELDQIAFLVDNCVTDEGAYPLTYQLLAWRNDAGNERSLTPDGLDSRVTVVGPSARPDGEGNNTFVIQVCNQQSSCASYVITVTVEDLQSFNYAALKEALVDLQVLRGDFTSAFRNINALIRVQADQSTQRRKKRATSTSQQALDQLMLLQGAINNTVLDVSTAATLLDECPSITVSDLSEENLDQFVRILQTLVSVFQTEMEAVPVSTSQAVVSITMAIEEATDDEEILYMIRSLIMSLTRARLADQTLGADAIQTMSAGVTSSAILALPQGTFPSHSGEGAINVDFGNEVAERYGAFWECESGPCTGASIQFSQYSDDIDPYSTNDEDRNDRASAILDITLYDPSSFSKLVVDSLTAPVSIHMPISLPKQDRAYECSFWDTTSNKWSTAGVETVMSTETLVECQTIHLSSFVVLAGDDIVPTAGPPPATSTVPTEAYTGVASTTATSTVPTEAYTGVASTTGDSTAIIIGCVIGGLVAIVIIIVIVVVVSKKKKVGSRDKEMGAKLSPADHVGNGNDNAYEFSMHNLDQPL